MNGIYSKKTIAKALNLPARTIEFWINQRLVLDDISNVQGKGRTKTFSGANLLEFGMIAVMAKKLNLPLELIWLVMDGIRRGGFGISRVAFLTGEQWGKTDEVIIIVDNENRYQQIFLRHNGSHELPASIFDRIFCDARILASRILFLGKIKLEAQKLFNI